LLEDGTSESALMAECRRANVLEIAILFFVILG
jgi:hypothetical protein